MELPGADSFCVGWIDGGSRMVGCSGALGASGSARRQAWSVIAVLGLLVALTPAAHAESRRDCVKMSRQINHFHDVKGMARARGDGAWERGTERHILHLEERHRRLCPEYFAEIQEGIARKSFQEMKEFWRDAARIAARYFTFGF